MPLNSKPGLRAMMLGAAALSSALPMPAAAQLFLTQPDFRAAPIEPSDPLVGVPLPGATPAEYRASLLWNLRAGLNVAALQCQFSPFLRAAPNYNGILAHHSVELASAYTTLNNYFKRVQGPVKGQKAFDDFSTITYNNWSTMAQMGFCQTAASIEKAALAAPKGQLFAVAQKRLRELRNSLLPASEPGLAYIPYIASVRLPQVPTFAPNCWTKKGELRASCGGTAAK